MVDNASPEDSSAAVADLPVRISRAAQRRLRLRLQPRRGGRHGAVRAAAQPRRADRRRRRSSARRRVGRDPGSAPSARGRRRRRRAAVHPAALPAPALDLRAGALPAPAAPLATWSDELDPRSAAYERPGSPEWVSGRLHAAPPLRARGVGGSTRASSSTARTPTSSGACARAGWRVRFEPARGRAPRRAARSRAARRRCRSARQPRPLRAEAPRRARRRRSRRLGLALERADPRVGMDPPTPAAPAGMRRRPRRAARHPLSRGPL